MGFECNGLVTTVYFRFAHHPGEIQRSSLRLWVCESLGNEDSRGTSGGTSRGPQGAGFVLSTDGSAMGRADKQTCSFFFVAIVGASIHTNISSPA